MIGKLRILPVVIVAAVLLFGIKLDNIRRDLVSLGVQPAAAQEKKANDGAPAKPAKTAGKDKPAAPSEAKSEMDAAEKADPGAALPKAKISILAGGASGFTPAEIEVLENLSRRREELERRTQSLAMREKLMAAAEKSVDAKIEELRKLEASISAMVKISDDEAESQLKSLVKVYESMKPESDPIFLDTELA